MLYRRICCAYVIVNTRTYFLSFSKPFWANSLDSIMFIDLFIEKKNLVIRTSQNLIYNWYYKANYV